MSCSRVERVREVEMSGIFDVYEENDGGAGGSRTPDILLAKQALWPAELQPHAEDFTRF